MSCVEPGETRYADGVLSRKIISLRPTGKTIEKSLQPRLCAVFFFYKVTASGRMSGQYVYNWSFRGILNTQFSQEPITAPDSVNKAVNLARN